MSVWHKKRLIRITLDELGLWITSQQKNHIRSQLSNTSVEFQFNITK